MKSIFIILLGCNITSLLMDRIFTAINFIENNQNSFNKITWYLTGGIKFEGDISEAQLMKDKLENIILRKNLHLRTKFSYILDEKSKNTAENFYRSSHYLNVSQEKYDDIYILTSKFHHTRAQLLMSYIDYSRKYDWILGNQQLTDSLYWESIHIKNVINDVEKLSTIEM